MEMDSTLRTISVVFFWLSFAWTTVRLVIFFKLDPLYKAEKREDFDDAMEAEAISQRPEWMNWFYIIWSPVSCMLIATAMIIWLAAIRW